MKIIVVCGYVHMFQTLAYLAITIYFAKACVRPTHVQTSNLDMLAFNRLNYKMYMCIVYSIHIYICLQSKYYDFKSLKNHIYQIEHIINSRYIDIHTYHIYIHVHVHIKV